MVMRRSAYGRSSFAFTSVVRMRSLSNNDVARLRRSATRCGVIRPSFRLATRCLMLLVLGLLPVVDLHPERQTHARQDLLDLVQGLAAEVLGLEHLGLGLLHQLADGPDVCVLQAVVGAHRQLQLVDALAE